MPGEEQDVCELKRGKEIDKRKNVLFRKESISVKIKQLIQRSKVVKRIILYRILIVLEINLFGVCGEYVVGAFRGALRNYF